MNTDVFTPNAIYLDSSVGLPWYLGGSHMHSAWVVSWAIIYLTLCLHAWRGHLNLNIFLMALQGKDWIMLPPVNGSHLIYTTFCFYFSCNCPNF